VEEEEDEDIQGRLSTCARVTPPPPPVSGSQKKKNLRDSWCTTSSVSFNPQEHGHSQLTRLGGC